MDGNTKDVLMAIIALVSAVVTPFIVLYVNKRQLEKIDTVEKKLDENHKLTNGHMSTLLETTKQLATANEKARHVAEPSTIPSTDAKLKITGGEIKITGETKKKS